MMKGVPTHYDCVRRENNLRATIERQAAEMKGRETAYLDALAAKSIRIDEQATLIESLQTEIARLRAGAMPEEVRETLLDGLDRASHWYNASHQGKRLECDNVEIEAARRWLESQPTATATDKAVCPKKGEKR